MQKRGSLYGQLKYVVWIRNVEVLHGVDNLKVLQQPSMTNGLGKVPTAPRERMRTSRASACVPEYPYCVIYEIISFLSPV